MMNHAAFFTVVYPAAEKFFADFLTSLEHQSCKAFDLVVANDGVQNLDLSGVSLNTRMIDCSGTPAQIRAAGLQFVREEGYKQVILGDSDDYFSSNRVEVSLRLLKQYDVVVNELDLVDETGAVLQTVYLAQRIGDGECITEDFIRDKNIFGLSNTALNISCLPQIHIPAEIVAVDWYIFSRLLARGARCVFSAAVQTYYRQHSENTAGLASQNPLSLQQAVKVKALHYSALYDEGFDSYCQYATEFNTLQRRLAEEQGIVEEYFNCMKSKSREFPLWWEAAMLPEKIQ